MLNHRDYGFSSKELCIRPRSGPSTRGGTPLSGVRENMHDRNHDPTSQLDRAAMEQIKAVDKLEQQLRDALYARSTSHFAEARVLKKAFTKFDRDCSGAVDFGEFSLALEHLGLHMEGKGLRGNGGLPPEVVRALFDRYDADASGELDYEEFCEGISRKDSSEPLNPRDSE